MACAVGCIRVGFGDEAMAVVGIVAWDQVDFESKTRVGAGAIVQD